MDELAIDEDGVIFDGLVGRSGLEPQPVPVDLPRDAKEGLAGNTPTKVAEEHTLGVIMQEKSLPLRNRP